MGIHTIGPVFKKPHLTQNCKNINCNFVISVPFVVPGLSTSSSTSSSPTSSTSSSQETVIGTKNPTTERSEIIHVWGVSGKPVAWISSKRKYKNMRTTKIYEVNYCVICRIGHRNSKRVWLLKVFLLSHGETHRMNIETLRVLLINYHWSCEQKWYRAQVSIVLKLTCSKTEIVKSAWGQKLPGLLAEDVLVQSCPKRKILVIW